MNKIIMLGVGNGGTLQLYNTCFVIQNLNGNFLVDTGFSSVTLGNRILRVETVPLYVLSAINYNYME